MVKNDYTIERLVLKIAAIATFLLGLSLLFFSAQIIKLFATDWGQERHFAVYLGTALIGFSVSNWLYSQSHNLAAVRPAIMGNLVSLISAFIIDAILLARQPHSLIIWLILLLHLSFAGAFTYCILNIRRLSKA